MTSNIGRGGVQPTGQRTHSYRPLSAVGLVAIGGAVGTLGRELLELATPDSSLVYTVLAINVLGSFFLAVIYALVANKVSTPKRKHSLRLLLGTGLMGGFTTYSTFTVGVVGALENGETARGLSYAGASIVLGPLAAILGARCVSTPRLSDTALAE